MTLQTISFNIGERFDEFDELVISLLKRNGGNLHGTSSGGGQRDYYVEIEYQNYLQVLNELRSAGMSVYERCHETKS